jgi:hypothetical protein
VLPFSTNFDYIHTHRKKHSSENVIRFLERCLVFIRFSQETLHFDNDGKVGGADEEVAQISEEVEAQVGLSNIETGKAKVSSDTSLKNLLKNWQFMSSVIIYCIFFSP